MLIPQMESYIAEKKNNAYSQLRNALNRLSRFIMGGYSIRFSPIGMYKIPTMKEKTFGQVLQQVQLKKDVFGMIDKYKEKWNIPQDFPVDLTYVSNKPQEFMTVLFRKKNMLDLFVENNIQHVRVIGVELLYGEQFNYEVIANPCMPKSFFFYQEAYSMLSENVIVQAPFAYP